MSDNYFENDRWGEDENAKWYAVYCKSRHEKKVAQQLTDKEIPHYLPLKEEIRQWSDRKKKVEVPLFRSYVFVKIPSSWQVPVLETYGAVRFVKFGRELIPVPQEQIEAVRKIEEYGVGLSQEKVDFDLNSRVKVTGGPCKGLTGHLVHRKKGERFVVVIDSIQLGASVEIEKHWLEPIQEEEEERT